MALSTEHEHVYVVDESRGESYCHLCGLVDPVPMMVVQESFDSDGMRLGGWGPKERKITPLPMPKYYRGDGRGHRIPNEQFMRMQRLAKLDRRGLGPRWGQELFQSANFVSTGTKLGIPQQTCELAHSLYAGWHARPHPVSHNDAVMAAAMVLATRLHSFYLSPKAICQECNTPPKRMWRVFRVMRPPHGTISYLRPEDMAQSFYRELNLSPNLRAMANDLLQRRGKEPEMMACIPRVMVAGIIVYVCRKTMTAISIDVIARKTGCTEPSARKAYKLLERLEGPTAWDPKASVATRIHGQGFRNTSTYS